LARRLGVAVGGRVDVGHLEAPLRVSALAADRTDLTREFMVLPPKAVLPGGPLAASLDEGTIGSDEPVVGTSRW
jgi:hypothetical protein